jgi:hypothetical protein
LLALSQASSIVVMLKFKAMPKLLGLSDRNNNGPFWKVCMNGLHVVKRIYSFVLSCNGIGVLMQFVDSPELYFQRDIFIWYLQKLLGACCSLTSKLFN